MKGKIMNREILKRMIDRYERWEQSLSERTIDGEEISSYLKEVDEIQEELEYLKGLEEDLKEIKVLMKFAGKIILKEKP